MNKQTDPESLTVEATARKQAEETFHDEWAAGINVGTIDVRKMNEACTAPEMRHIRAKLGDLRGARLLDVGCGLGEASVYFALEGAQVTASDISPGMLEVTRRLADANGVKVRTVLSAAEDMGLDLQQPFDIIYTGNTLHHVDIGQTLARLLPYLKATGTFVSWDPVAYNPLINVYRVMAKKVRTEDEHPLHLRDVRAVQSCFVESEVRWCWLSTLAIFVIMAVVQLRNPNKERFWKKVVEEGDRWAWLYMPLEKLDRLLLKIAPFLRPLCWNVIIVGRGVVRGPAQGG
jgi:SAM-dependent methyltransferase